MQGENACKNIGMLAVGVVYAGLIAALAGVVSLVKPLAFLGISTRPRGAAVLAAGLIVACLGCLLPARERRVGAVGATSTDTAARTRLDEFAPVYQFNEVHRVEVRAPRERVFQAIKAVKADEILFFRTLTWMRRFGRASPASILNPPEQSPLLEVATRTSFLLLAEEPGREIVVGTVVAAPRGTRLKARPTPEDFKALEGPGFAKATMNFRLEDAGAGECVVTTETRVYATDGPTRRRFAGYWRVIYPGSALIRRMWLRAVKWRAEAGG